MTDKAQPFLEASERLSHFVVTEIELAITFAEMARDAPDNRAKRSRNFANALKAYKEVQRFMQRCRLTSDQSKKLQPMLDKLNGILSSLADSL